MTEQSRFVPLPSWAAKGKAMTEHPTDAWQPIVCPTCGALPCDWTNEVIPIDDEGLAEFVLMTVERNDLSDGMKVIAIKLKAQGRLDVS